MFEYINSAPIPRQSDIPAQSVVAIQHLFCCLWGVMVEGCSVCWLGDVGFSIGDSGGDGCNWLSGALGGID